MEYISKKSHYARCTALELLCKSFCGHGTQNFGDPWSIPCLHSNFFIFDPSTLCKFRMRRARINKSPRQPLRKCFVFVFYLITPQSLGIKQPAIRDYNFILTFNVHRLIGFVRQQLESRPASFTNPGFFRFDETEAYRK